jgi:hypothetical protein
VCLFIGLPTKLTAQQGRMLELAWNAPSDEPLSYKLYYGPASGEYSRSIAVGSQTTYVLGPLAPGTYFVAVTAINSAGTESAYSNEVHTTIDPMPAICSRVTFDDPIPAGSPGDPITGVFQGIDFGEDGWKWSGPYGSAASNSIYFDSEFGDSRSFRFTVPRVLAAVTVFAPSGGALSVTDDSGQSMQAEIRPGVLQIIPTGWKTQSNRVSVTAAAGPELALDEIRCGDAGIAAESDNTPPLISNPRVSAVTSNAAVIKWTTDRPADSRASMGSASHFGLTAADARLVLEHSLAFSDLVADSEYRFRASSRSASGAIADSDEIAFKTAPAVAQFIPQTTLRTPAFIQTPPGRSSNEQNTHLSLVNAAQSQEQVWLRGYDANGTLLQGANILNPTWLSLGPGELRKANVAELFGERLGGSSWDGWIQVDSSSPLIFGQGAISESNPVELHASGLDSFIFPELGRGNPTEIRILNPSSVPATVLLSLQGAPIQENSSVERTIAPGTLLAEHLHSLFGNVNAEGSQVLRGVATQPVISLGVVKATSRGPQSLPAAEEPKETMKLYGPLYLAGDGWQSQITVINHDPVEAIARVDLYDASGTPVDSREHAVAGRSKLRLAHFELFVATAQAFRGYVRVTSSGPRLSGSVSIAHGQQDQLSITLPLAPSSGKSAVFLEASSTRDWYTSLAVLNPGAAPAPVLMELFDASGNRVGTAQLEIAPNACDARLLTEYFPQLTGMDFPLGYVNVHSGNPLSFLALRGKTDSSALSPLPAHIR